MIDGTVARKTGTANDFGSDKKEKNRFYMTESLIEKLNDEIPKRSEIFDLLGKPALEGRISNNEVSYWLKTEGFTIWELAIHFDNEGNFISAKAYRED